MRRTRVFSYAGLKIKVPTGVFHPGLYGSTGLLLRFLDRQALVGKKLIEIGTGSGLPAIFAARKGADVTATDLSEQAVQTALFNAHINGVRLQVLHSDLWEQLPPGRYEIMVVNPPYFAKAPANTTECAFFAGADLEYFDRFFEGAARFLTPDGVIWMILSEHCALDRIAAKARQQGFRVQWEAAGRWWGEAFLTGHFAYTEHEDRTT